MNHVFHRFFPVLMLLAVIFSVQAQTPSLTLEQIWKDDCFSPKTIRLGKSMQGGEHYTVVEDRYKINKYEYASGKLEKTLLDIEGKITNEEGDSLKIDNYLFDPQENQILIATETEAIFRHSSVSHFYLVDLASGQVEPLSLGGKQRLPRFSPDGSKIAFVRDNNIFLRAIDSDKEIQITHDGLYNHIINGTTDWVYEEEFSFTLGHQWSPDSKHLAFYKFEESQVKEFNMLLYGNLYPDEHRFKYPKAGEDNALVSVHIYNLETEETIKTDMGEQTNQYIPRIRWTTDSEVLAVYRLNRHQNHLEILAANAATGAARVLYEEKNKYYIDINDDLLFTPNGESFIVSSEANGFKHLYQYTMQGELVNAVTSGQWDVNSFLGFDEKTQKVYFTSHEESPLENHLYSINLDGSNKARLTHGEGYHSPSFSNNFKYFLNNYSTINTPPVYSLHAADGSLIKVLEDNDALKQKTENHHYEQVSFIKIPLEEQLELNAWVLHPPDFNPAKEYPVFMYVYGGPGSQTVTDRWNANNGAWFQMLAQMGYIVVSVDNRGTGARGEEFRKMTYMQLGKYETEDLIHAATYLGSLEYIDAQRIGIFGWSYGGYLSSLCITKGADVFAAAIAVAPVTTWRFYDTVYTERYMRTPQENPDGYDDNSPINHVDKIKGNYLLVHGSADDNVHYQNTMEMVSALTEADVDFELMIYPNHNHGIRGGNSRLHLYRMMTDFLARNLLNKQGTQDT